MNENAYRVRAERGEIQIGTWVTMIRTPAVLTLLKAAGLDFAPIDMEHSPFSIETVADMAALARAMDFPMVVRPPEGNREWITRLLDAGVWNLHVPQVDTAARKNGKAVAMLTDSAEGVKQMISLGATIINYSSDAAVLRAGYASAVEEIRRALPARS